MSTAYVTKNFFFDLWLTPDVDIIFGVNSTFLALCVNSEKPVVHSVVTIPPWAFHLRGILGESPTPSLVLALDNIINSPSIIMCLLCDIGPIRS